MYPESKGRVARQAHVGIPEGTFEEEHGRQGFTGKSSQLYHLHMPTGWVRVEGPMRPRCFAGSRAEAPDLTDANAGPMLIASNDDCAVLISRRRDPMPYLFRNADGDEFHFVHRGTGTYDTDYGPLAYEPGDYLYFPKGASYQIKPDGGDNLFLIIRSVAELAWPDRGLLGKHAFIDPQLVETPEPVAHDEQGEWELRVLRQGDTTSFFYPYHPFDVVGWKGDLAPMRFNVRDLRPIISAGYHVAPTVHATLFSDTCSICTFAPRPLETDPQCEKVPYYHRNVDWDELIFYHAGEFFSRGDIEPASMTLHPQGIHHGPQPNARNAARNKTHTNEVAVLIETKNPLRPSAAAAAIELPEYATSWSRQASR
ncbi:MAG: homogentisate 1,2-dioxygenase [Candidatus Binataceae bacterium]